MMKSLYVTALAVACLTVSSLRAQCDDTQGSFVAFLPEFIGDDDKTYAWMVDDSNTFDISNRTPTQTYTCSQFGIVQGVLTIGARARGIDAYLTFDGYDQSLDCALAREESAVGLSRRDYFWCGDAGDPYIGEVEFSATAAACATASVSRPHAGAYAAASGQVGWFWAILPPSPGGPPPIPNGSASVLASAAVALEAFPGDLAPLTGYLGLPVSVGTNQTQTETDSDEGGGVIPCIRAFSVVMSCAVSGGASLNGRLLDVANASGNATSSADVMVLMSTISIDDC